MNIIKGWATTIIGLVIIGLTICEFYGLIPLPHISSVPKPIEQGVAFLIGLTLLLVEPGWIEDTLKKIINKQQDK